jgi:hypothetical protein
MCLSYYLSYVNGQKGIKLTCTLCFDVPLLMITFHFDIPLLLIGTYLNQHPRFQSSPLLVIHQKEQLVIRDEVIVYLCRLQTSSHHYSSQTTSSIQVNHSGPHMPVSNPSSPPGQCLDMAIEDNVLSTSVETHDTGAMLQANSASDSGTSQEASPRRWTDEDHFGLLEENRAQWKKICDMYEEREEMRQEKEEMRQQKEDMMKLIETLQEEIEEQKKMINGQKSLTSNTAGDRNDLDVEFGMLIHKEHGSYELRMCRLDTGSPMVNLVASSALQGLAPQRRAYKGMPIRGIEGTASGIIPEWEVELRWHVWGKSKTYTTWFTVWDEDVVGADLGVDILLGRETIAAKRFLIRNTEVYLISEESAMTLPVVQNGGV